MLVGPSKAPDAPHEGNGTDLTRGQRIAFLDAFRNPQVHTRTPKQGLHAGMNVQDKVIALRELVAVNLAILHLPGSIRTNLPAVPLAVHVPQGNSQGRGSFSLRLGKATVNEVLRLGQRLIATC